MLTWPRVRLDIGLESSICTRSIPVADVGSTCSDCGVDADIGEGKLEISNKVGRDWPRLRLKMRLESVSIYTCSIRVDFAGSVYADIGEGIDI